MTIKMKTRSRLLAGVGTTVLAATLSTGANAAETIVNYGSPLPWELTANATGFVVEGSNSLNTGFVRATVLDAVVDLSATSGANNVDGTVNANTISAIASGNLAEDVVDLATIGADLIDGDGIAVLQASVNGPGASVSSAVSGTNLGNTFEVDDTPNVGTYEVIGNRITATTTLNDTSMAVDGEIPGSYSSATIGSIAFDSDVAATNVLVSEGSIAVTSAQANIGAGPGQAVVDPEDPTESYASGAVVTDNTIALTITPDDAATADQVIASSPRLDNNDSIASYTGNNSVSRIGIEGGDNPAFAGSAVVTSVQANLDGGTGTAAALNEDTTISATIGANPDNADAAIMLDGTLSVSGNTVASSASGNTSNGGDAFGNEVVLESGLSYSGDGRDYGTDPSGARLVFDGGAATADVGAGLAVFSSQSNVDTEHSSRTSGATIEANVDQMIIADETGGSIMMEGNVIGSAATGNSGRNRILAPGLGDSSTTTFNGSAAVASAQINYGAPVSATTEDGKVRLNLGSGEDSALIGGAAVLEENRINAVAQGNTVVNALAPSATTVILGSSDAGQGAEVSGGHIDDGEISVSAGASLANLQANDLNSPISAAVEDSAIGIALSTDGDGNADIDSSTLRNVGGEIVAEATANNASNTVGIEGTSIAGSAALGNVQVNNSDATDPDADVSASVSGSSISIYRDTDGVGQLEDSTVELAGNEIAATARGSVASNAFSVSGTNILTRPDGESADTLAASTVTLDGLAISDEVGSLPEARATFALLNSQGMEGDVSSVVDNSGSTPFLTDLLSSQNSTILVDGNSLAATAYANEANSSMSIDASASLAVDAEGGDEYGAVASLTSTQIRTDESDVTAQITGQDNQSFVLSLEEDAQDSSLSLSGNAAVVEARGNLVSGNTMTVTGNDISAAPSASEAGAGQAGMVYDSTAGEATGDAAFVVQNVQSGGTGVISATQLGTGALIEIGGSVDASNVLMEANGFGAIASDNYASNRLEFDATSVSASGGVQNVQFSSGDVVADLGVAGTAATPPVDYTASLDAVVSGTPSYTFDVGTNLTTINFDPGEEISIDISGLSGAELAALQAILPGWVVSGGNLVANSSTGAVTFDESNFGSSSFNVSMGNLTSINLAEFSFGGAAGTAASPSVIASITGDIEDSTVSVIGSQAVASALANQAFNTLVAEGNSITGGAGIATNGAGVSLGMLDEDGEGNQQVQADYAVSNVQVQGEDGSSFAEATGTYAIEATIGDGGSEITDSTLIVDGTRQAATARGNVADNVLTLDATQTDDGTGTASAAIGSSQVTSAEGATADDPGIHSTSWMSVSAPAAIDDSTLSMSDNENRSAATANQVANYLSASGNSLSTARNAAAAIGIDPISGSATGSADLTVLSSQSSNTNVLADATTQIINQDAVDDVGDPVDTVGISDSTALIENNRTVATARGNWGGSTIDVDGGASSTAMTSLGSSQFLNGTTTADADADISFILWDEDGTVVFNSTVGVNDNLAQSRALGNDAVNEISIAASGIGGTVTTDASANIASIVLPAIDAEAEHVLGNIQSGTADATVSGTANLSVTGTFAGEDSAIGLSSVSFDGNTSRAEGWGNTADNSIGIAAGATAATTAALQNLQTFGADVSSEADLSVNITASADDEAGDTISNSALSVDGNRTVALTVVNDAANAVSATGANVESVGGAPDASAVVDVLAGTLSNTADYVSSSMQVGSGAATADANTEISVGLSQASSDSVIGTSTLTIDGNITVAESRGNLASSSVSTGDIANGSTANVDTTSALLNAQLYAGGDVTANAAATIGLESASTPAGTHVNASTLSIGGNQTAAIAVSNTGTNTVSVRGTNVRGASVNGLASVNAGAGVESLSATGTHVLNSAQTSTNLTEATATANITASLGDLLSTGAAIEGSSVDVSTNVVVAEARGNQVANTMNLEAGNLGATGTLANLQYRNGFVNAFAENVTVEIVGSNSGAEANTANSSLSLMGNSTASVARGNSATNALNVTAHAGYATPNAGGSALTSVGTPGGNASANYSVLNAQQNDSDVSARTSGTYRVALNGGATSGSTVLVNNNQFAANAAGNSAANSITLSTLPSGNASAALTSIQVNTSPITASVTGTRITASGSGFGTSSVGVNGNSISASAIGNSVSNAIRRN